MEQTLSDLLDSVEEKVCRVAVAVRLFFLPENAVTVGT